LDSRGVARPKAPVTYFLRLVLKFVAGGSCWPSGQSDYRTGV